MPWWVIPYLIVLAGISVAGVLDDLRDGDPLWYLAAGLLSACFCLVFVIAWWQDWMAAFLGKSLLPMFLFAISWDVASLLRDLKKMGTDPEPSTVVDAWIPGLSIAVAIAILLPAYYCGVVLSVRAWRFL